MKASELVKRLNELIAEHGDYPVAESFSGDSIIIGSVTFDYDPRYVDIPAVFALWEK